MGEEGSKTLVVVGVVLGGLCLLACLAGTAFLFFGVRMSSGSTAVTVSAPVAVAAAPKPLTVVLLPDAGVVFDDAPVTDTELVDELTQHFDTDGDVQVVLAADERVPYTRVVQVLDLTRKIGFTRVALGVRRQ